MRVQYIRVDPDAETVITGEDGLWFVTVYRFVGTTIGPRPLAWEIADKLIPQLGDTYSGAGYKRTR